MQKVWCLKKMKIAAKGEGVQRLFPFLNNASETLILKQNCFHKNKNIEPSTTMVPKQLSRAYPAGDFLDLDNTWLQKHYYIAFGNFAQFWKVTFKMASSRMLQGQHFASRNNL